MATRRGKRQRFRRLHLEVLEDRRMLSGAGAPSLVDLQALSDSGASDNDNLTNVLTPVIDITAETADDVIRVYREGLLLGEATQVNGILYQYTFSDGQLLEGTNTITARAFDGIEEGVDSPPLAIVLDTTGPRITAATPDAPVNLRAETLDSVAITFTEAIVFGSTDDGSLSVEDVTINGPQGGIAPTTITSLGNNDYNIGFAAQTRRGTYAVSVGPEVADLAGNLMDQDQNGQGGQLEDVHSFDFDAFDADTVFTSDTAIAASEATYDGLDICIIGATVTVDGSHSFDSVHLIEGAVLTHTAESADGLDLAVTEEIIVDDSSLITADGKGYGGNSGPGAGGQTSLHGGGGGYGGLGATIQDAPGGFVYGSITEPADFGSGGGKGGGAGGGRIRLSVGGELRVDGQIRANGNPGGWYYPFFSPAWNRGGGSGGSVWITAAAFSGDGTISANGGDIGGGGGRIAIYYDTDQFSGTLSARADGGGAGTIFTKSSTQDDGDLLIANGRAATPLLDGVYRFHRVEVRGGALLDLSDADSLHCDELVLSSNAQLVNAGEITAPLTSLGAGVVVTVNEGSQFRIDQVEILSGGTLLLNNSQTLPSVHIASGGVLSYSSNGPGLELTVTGDLTVDAGGSITADGKGYDGGTGPGAGEQTSLHGGGGGYGGLGETIQDAPGGPVYGSITEPVDFGSGGGKGGGAGGGRIRLSVGGELRVDGEITANGNPGGWYYPIFPWNPPWNTGGGSGGSVWITTATFSGSGMIRADGGDVGGGGGRIAVYYDTDQFAGTLSAGGVGGGAGTIFTKSSTQDHGDLLIANGGATTPLLDGVYTFDHVELLSASMTVATDATLTMEPGSIFKAEGSSSGIVVEGALDINGTASQPVIFTSYRDDTADGDTNGDGDATAPAAGNWKGISLTDPTANATLDHAEIRYAETALEVRATGASVEISNSILRDSRYGLFAHDVVPSKVEATNCVIADNEEMGVYLHGDFEAVLRNCTIVGNGFGDGAEASGIHATGVLFLENSIVAFNRHGFHTDGNPLLSIRNSLFHNPAGSEITGTDDAILWQQGNIMADPRFVDRTAGNYELDANSPAIDAGRGFNSPEADILDRPRYDDPGIANLGTGYPSYVDMGAFERLIPSPVKDLAVTLVSDPAPIAVQPGEDFTVTWTVENAGETDLGGGWTDALYLSDDPYLSPAVDELLHEEPHGNPLQIGDIYTVTWTGPVPAGMHGTKYVLVDANSNQIFRESTLVNNVRATEQALAVDMPVLELGVPQIGQVDQGDWSIYRFEVDAVPQVLLALDSDTGSGSVQLYIRRDMPPTVSDYDVAATAFNQADQQVWLSDPAEGTYYVGIYGHSLPQGATNFTLTANLTTLDIRAVTPNEVGNAGSTTIRIDGDSFSTETQVQLVGPDGTIIEGTEYRQDPISLFATFDLAGEGADPGLYDVVVRNPGLASYTEYDALTVVARGAAELQANLVVPGLSRPGRIVDVRIEYANTGNVDLPSPLFSVQSTQNLAWRFADSPVPGGDAWFEADTVTLLGLSDDGPPSILRPGQSYTYTIEARTPSREGSALISLSVLGVPGQAGLAEAINWDQLKQDLQPVYISSDSWEPLFERFKVQIGDTWGDFLVALRDNAAHLAELDQRVYDANQLFAFEFVQAASMGVPVYLERELDAFSPGAGLSLSFERYFLPEPAYRARQGSLGRGWTHSYEITLRQYSDGSVVFNGPGGFDRIFRPDGDGGYVPSPCDYATLTAEADGGFLLIEKHGLKYRFGPGGLFEYMEEPNGNRITATYDGDGKLVRVTHSSGDHFDFDYDTNGRLKTLTDHVGRVTTFAYDPSGVHLLSVTRPDGKRSSYTYITGEGLLRDHSLTLITDPVGLVRSFSYDHLGRLKEQHLGSGEESVRYSYSTAGKRFETDALGNTTTIWLDSSGRVGRIEDPLHTVTNLRYDAASNLTGIVAPTGLESHSSYDKLGNLVSAQDPLGNVTNFAYGEHDVLVWARDARGNMTHYGYDGAGNLTGVGYDDASLQYFVYDAVGNLVSWTNRRAQTVSYDYNDRGQVTQKSYPDGTTFTYTYDAVGRLTRATDTHGTTILQYDPDNDWLTRIDYPSGRFLEYEYDDAGRRTQIVDQDGFTVNYQYDDAGRLAGLTDANGDPIVTYTYNTAGRLMREDKGNGTYTTYEYDAAGQVLHLVNYAPDGSVNSRFDYTYDALGRRTTMATLDGTWTYQYDDNGQLVHAVFDSTNPDIDDQELTYVYDAAGNRVRTIINGVTTEYTTNNMNQYTLVGTATYGYDSDGNLISKVKEGDTWTYMYDDENRLTEAVTPDGTWRYEYDPFGNWSAIVAPDGRTELLVDPLAPNVVVGEYDEAGKLILNRTYGIGLIARVDSAGNWFYYDFDAPGSTVGLSDTTGKYVNASSYRPFWEYLTSTEQVRDPYGGAMGRWGVRKLASAASGIADCLFKWDKWYNWRRIVDWPPARGIIIDELPPKDCLAELFGPNPPAESSEPVVRGSGAGGQDGGDWGDEDECRGQGCEALEDVRKWREIYKFFSGEGPKIVARAWDVIISSMVTAPITAFLKFRWSLALWAFQLVQYIWPKDPEDKFGPIGYDPPGTPPGSEMRYLAIEDAMDYRVEIWNHEDAQVAAQDVMIEDTLDPDLFDLSTLEFTRFGFLRWDVPLPGGQAIDARVDMRPDMNLVVDVTASLDPETGKIEWWFHSMDPMTGDYPEDPRAGFLPPFNPETGYELGWVEFRVKPRADLPSGTRIENRAYGEFDFMGDRYNNPAPPDGPWINTIDAGIPDDASRVSPLPPATTETSFLVRWSGQDEPNGSGIGAYDIYVSIDDGPFDPWLESTPESSAVWTGESGHKYSFYSVATDNVGHREPTPLVPDTEIIIAGAWHNATNPYDVNAQDGVTPLDVLTLINYINSHPGDFSLPNPPDSPPPPPPFYDVNDDNLCSPLDVLLVINYINSKSRATIEVTDVPPYGVDGFVSGRVTGVDFSTHRVAPYIQIEGSGWWTKPTAETRAVPINPDGTFTADVATGGIDNRATIFCAALVADEINPPLALGDSRIPASLESMVLDCRERYARTIEFAGYTWGVKESPIPVGPNANRFSDDATDVFVDQQGLHLTVNLNDQNPQDEYWSATEVILLDRLGYGTYSFQTNSRLDELDPNVTFGAFTWDSYGDDQSGASPDREIDFEDSRWGNPNDPTNAQMVVQPFGTPGNLERYTIPDLSEDPALTRFFTWQPGQIKFVALRGHHTPADFPEADVIHRWVYVEDPGANHFVPTEGRESFRFNLWLNSGSAPANGQPVEVVITDFRYTRLTAAASAEGELPLESINRFLPLTQVGHAQPPAVQGASASLRAATDVPRTNYAEPIPLEDMDLRVVSRDQRTVRQSLTYGFGESDAELTYLDTVLPDIVGDIASVWRQL